MMRRHPFSVSVAITFLALVASVHLTGCTSSNSKDDQDAAQSDAQNFAEEGEGDFADGAKKADAAKDAPKDALAQETPPVDDLGPDAKAAADKAAQPPDDLALGDASKNPEPVADAPKDASKDAPKEAVSEAAKPAAPTDEPLFKDEPPAPPAIAANDAPADKPLDAPAVVPVETPKAAAAPVSTAPYQKVKDAPFQVAGVTLNRVYLARPKDNLKSVSKKLYGDSAHTKKLLTWNSMLKRGVRPGDKIYYASAKSPDDAHMMNFYEEAGVPLQTYVSKDGESLQPVAKNLLGFKDAWKEVWATNPQVASKTSLPAGTELRYWNDAVPAVPAPEAVQASTAAEPAAPPPPAPPADSMAQNPPPLPAQPANGLPPEPPKQPDMAANNSPPVSPPAQPVQAQVPPPPPEPPQPQAMPSPPAAAVGAVNNPPPMVPPGAGQAKPPGLPNAKKEKPKRPAPVEEASGTDQDTMMAIGFGGILLIAAAVLFVIIRRNRSKQRMEMGQTQA